MKRGLPPAQVGAGAGGKAGRREEGKDGRKEGRKDGRMEMSVRCQNMVTSLTVSDVAFVFMLQSHVTEKRPQIGTYSQSRRQTTQCFYFEILLPT